MAWPMTDAMACRIAWGLAAPLALTVLLAACGDSAPAPAPSPLPPASAPAPAPEPTPSPSPPSSPFGTVSGVAYEHALTGSRPLAGLRFLVVWFPQFSPWDYPDNPWPTEVTTDGSGRYEVAIAPGAGQVVIALAERTGFHAPCPPGFDGRHGDATMDIHVVSDATLASAGAPASLPTTPSKVGGVVLEDEEAGGRPIGGATVSLGSDGGWLNAYTLTDADGHFLVCTNPPGVANGESMSLAAYKEGYRVTSRSVVIGRDDRVSLELERN